MRNAALKTREIEPDVYLPFGRHVTDTVISLTTRALLTVIRIDGTSFETAETSDLNDLHGKLDRYAMSQIRGLRIRGWHSGPTCPPPPPPPPRAGRPRSPGAAARSRRPRPLAAPAAPARPPRRGAVAPRAARGRARAAPPRKRGRLCGAGRRSIRTAPSDRPLRRNLTHNIANSFARKRCFATISI